MQIEVVIGKESFFPPLLIEGTQIDQSGDLATKLGQIWLLFIPALLRVVQCCLFLLATIAQFWSLKSCFENQNNQINFEETLLLVKDNCVFLSVDCRIFLSR